MSTHAAARPLRRRFSTRPRGRSFSRIEVPSPLGFLWVALIAWDFFLISYPAALMPDFDQTLDIAVVSTAAVAAFSVRRLRLPYIPWTLGLLVAAMWLSCLWSMDPGQTRSVALLYTMVAVIGLVIGCNVGARAVAWGFALGGVTIAVTSWYAFATEIPRSFYDARERVVITGVGTNQNILAYTLVIALAATLTLMPIRRDRIWLVWAPTCATLLAGIYVARSSTGFLSTAAVVAAFAGLLVSRAEWLTGRAKWRVGALLAVLGLGCVYVVHAVLGDSLATFSDRVPFWRATLETIDDRWFAGYGWGTVWEHGWAPAPSNEPADRIYDAAGLVLAHGHNAFIDFVPELGALGVVLAAAMVVAAVVRALRTGRSQTDGGQQAQSLALLLVVALMTFGITEPMLTIPLGWWTLVIALTVDAREESVGDATARRRKRNRRRVPRERFRRIERSELLPDSRRRTPNTRPGRPRSCPGIDA